MPTNRIRIATDWALDAILPRQLVQMGLVRSAAVPLVSGTPEHPAGQAASEPASAAPKGG
jgi:NADH dehydrogenase